MIVKGDLHTHSSASDGRDTPEQLVLTAVEKELDFIAVTDHDSFEGGIRARRYVESVGLDLLAIVGAEVRTDWGDILVLCSDNGLDRIPRNPLELVEIAHENNCIVIPAHPFDVRRKGIGKRVYEARWDAIEVFNAHSDPIANRKAAEAARITGLPGIACSDAHVASSIGAAYTRVEVDEYSVESILEAIQRGNVVPVPGRPSARAVLETVGWSVRRRISKYDERRLRKLEEWADLQHSLDYS